MQATLFATPIQPASVPWGDNHADEFIAPPGAPQQVAMGQLKVGTHAGHLQALLGSCVGIAFIWKKQRRCALAHCLLPECEQANNELGARYVSQAVPSLLRLIGATEADYADIEVVLAGGATMLNGCSSRFQIGQQNADAARRHLRKYGLHVSYCRVGGKSGRTMNIDCATCEYTVQEISPSSRTGVAHA
ncbi:chemotaxis protein CheD [Duganella sp.]|uniref:chemotaxis protein CheD n=1 Tax=Duganella sp. TaxID=1904440 RepID=UPI0031D3FD6B